MALGLSALLFFQAPAGAVAVLHDHVPAAAKRLQPIGRLESAAHLDLAIGLPLRNREALTNLLREIYSPASANYHHYLTPEQFAERFGPTEKDYRALMEFAKSNHLTVTGVHPNRALLDVNGAVADIEKAFHLTLRTYRHPTEARNFHAPDAEPSLDIAIPVLGISGLDDFNLPRPMNLGWFTNDANATPLATGSGPRGFFIGKDFRAAYAPGVSLDGSGQSVGLFELDKYYADDIAQYESLAGLPPVPLTNVILNGFNGAPGRNNVEVALDIDMAIAMAPGLSQVIVYQGSVPNDVLNRMATDNLAKQLSSSWSFGSQVDNVREQIFLQFATQGQSMFESSGDFGAYSGTVATPSDDPNITVVGGTSLTTSGPGGAWLSETAWSGSGGGFSTTYAIPTWQQGTDFSTNQGSATKRNIPDVACLADGVIWLVANNGEQSAIGGTSASAPLWAGFIALVNQRAAAEGKPNVGFLNPALYALGQGGSYASAFHDITTGNNTNSTSANKFLAVAGYDLCTGWGTPTGSNLIDALLAPPDSLAIAPENGFAASGLVNGPFSPTGQSYILTNAGTVSLNWTLAGAPAWLDVSPNSGTLTPGGAAATVTLSLNSAATNLWAGNYAATVWFTNLNDGVGLGRPVTLAVIAPPMITPGTAFTVLRSFTGGDFGGNPNALTQGADGNLYGTTHNGGSNFAGTIFQLTTNGAPTLLYSFTGGGDGAAPYGKLMQGMDGSFFGTTFAGGAYTNGTVFNITAGGALATLVALNVTNGDLPRAGMILAADGNFYGTTHQGGSPGHGTAFKMTPAGALTTLVSFNDSNGGFPYAGLAPGTDGNLYGTTFKGGVRAVGTVFRMTTNGVLTTLVSFNGTNGSFPYAGLTPGSDGNFYGAASSGGANSNGTVFKITAAGLLTTLHSFTSSGDGGHPVGGLIQGTDGNFYGTTASGGPYGDGTVFRMAPDGTLTNLVEFDGYNGAHPETELLEAADGSFYGTTENGGAGGFGVVFRLQVTSPLQITSQPVDQNVFVGTDVKFSVAVFGRPPLFFQWQRSGTNLTDGGNISGAATRILSISNAALADGAIYSVTISNALGSMTNSSNAMLAVTSSPPVITMQPTNLTLSPGAVAIFTAAAVGNLPLTYQWRKNGTNLADGGKISGSATTGLTISQTTEADDGTYSVAVSNALDYTVSSGATLVVIPVSAPGTRLTSLHFFTGGDDGGAPNGLMEGADGGLYGTTTTALGATNRGGTIFKLSGGVFTTLASFAGTNGSSPRSTLAQAANGDLYGTTTLGGGFGEGSAYKLTTNGALVNLFTFAGDENGGSPYAGLTRGVDGNFYGLTQDGGANGYGTIFRLSPDGALTTLYSFTGGTDGSAPNAAMALGTDGNFYGMTQGGTNGHGNVFRFTPGGAFTNLYSFSGGTDGGSPAGTLVQGRDGNFYGATTHNLFHGFQFYGTIFRITTNGALATLYMLNFTDGSYPYAGLIQGSDGNFYGTTYGGGASSNGTLFRITPGGQITTLVSFDGFDDGAQPQAALVQAADRNFYGTTSTGGPGGHGTVFRFSVLFPPVFQNVTQTNGLVTLTWSAVGGVKYQPQYKTNATGTNWINLGNAITATSAQASVSDSITTDPQRFYRIVLLP
jgi:uncharacterized repeat protein (TIGR03803 family)